MRIICKCTKIPKRRTNSAYGDKKSQQQISYIEYGGNQYEICSKQSSKGNNRHGGNVLCQCVSVDSLVVLPAFSSSPCGPTFPNLVSTMMHPNSQIPDISYPIVHIGLNDYLSPWTNSVWRYLDVNMTWPVSEHLNYVQSQLLARSS